MRLGVVVKGLRFRDHHVVGDILTLAVRYRDEGADEIVFYDIAASAEGRRVDAGWVRKVAQVIDIPFCVAGGIHSVADAEELLNGGAEKVSINSPALLNPDLIDALARRFGSQCVVVGIDSYRTETGHRAWLFTGDGGRARDGGRYVSQWIREVQDRGAGEIVVNCMTHDGVREGYDVEQLRDLRGRCHVPLIASGGAGTIQHFSELFSRTGVDGALAASVFHSGTIHISDLKWQLRAAGIAVRPPDSQPS